MKNNIHPSYHASATITCSCGAHYTTGSTQEEMVVEVCAHCHPFYTGEKKVVDTTGRVDRFKRMAARSVEKKEARAKAKPKTEKKSSTKKELATKEKK